MEYNAETWHLDEFWDVEYDCLAESFKSSKLMSTYFGPKWAA